MYGIVGAGCYWSPSLPRVPVLPSRARPLLLLYLLEYDYVVLAPAVCPLPSLGPFTHRVKTGLSQLRSRLNSVSLRLDGQAGRLSIFHYYR